MADEKRKSIPVGLGQEIGQFDSSDLKKTEVNEKNPLPSSEAIAQEKTIQNIEAFDKGQLRPTTTEEKNTLPDKATIDQEKTTKWAALCVTNLSPTMPWWSQSALLRSATPCNRVAIYTVVSLLYVDFSACASIGRQLLVFY